MLREHRPVLGIFALFLSLALCSSWYFFKPFPNYIFVLHITSDVELVSFADQIGNPFLKFLESFLIGASSPGKLTFLLNIFRYKLYCYSL